MKKSLVFLLVFAILINSCVLAFADDVMINSNFDNHILEVQPIFSGGDKKVKNVYTDVVYKMPLDFSDIDDDGLKKQAEVLFGLGILDGDLDISQSVTKAEFISWTLKLINAKVPSVQVNTYFADVYSDNKYISDIEHAAALGIINGNGGLFFPDKVISANEAVTIVMKALGYKVYAEVNGGYPAGYYAAAKKSGMVVGFEETDVKLKDAICLLYGALNANTLTEDSYSNDGIGYSSETVLSCYHDMYVINDRVNANFVTGLDGRSSTEEDMVLIGDTKYLTAGKMMYGDLIGYDTETYIKEINGRDTVVLMVKDEHTDEIIINASDIISYSDYEYRYGENKEKKVSKNHSLIVNGVRLSDYTEADFVPSRGEVILVSNGNRDADVVFVNSFSALPVCEIVGAGESEIVFKSPISDMKFTIDTASEDRLTSFYLDGREIEIDVTYDIVQDADGEDYKQYKMPKMPEHVLLNIFADKYTLVNNVCLPSPDAKIVKVYITTKCVEGYVESLSDDEITIDGNPYYIAKDNILHMAGKELVSGVSGKFLFDYEGNVTAYLPDAKQIGYGYLIDANPDSSFADSKLELKIMDTSGKVGIYECKNKVRLNGKNQKLDVVYSLLKESALFTRDDGEISQLVTYSLDSSNMVNALNIMTKSTGYNKSENTVTRNCEKTSLSSRHENGYSLYNATTGAVIYNAGCSVMFSVPDNFSSDDSDYYMQKRWGEDRLARNVEVYDCDENLVPGAIVIYRGEKEALEYPYFMVESVKQEFDEDGNVVSCIYGTDGVNNYQTRYWTDDDKLFKDLKCGDFLAVYGKNDYIESFDLLMPIDKVKAFDFSRPMPKPDSAITDLFELYSVYDNSYVVLQRGEIIENGAREYQQCNSTNQYDENMFVYDASAGKKPTVGYFFNPESFDTVLNNGIQGATKIFIYTSGTVTKFAVAYKGI